MKKKIAVLLVLVLLGCSALWAEKKNFWGFDTRGASIGMDVGMIALGGVAAAVPLFDADMASPPYSYVLFGLGGTLAVIGIIGLIYDLSTGSDKIAAIDNKDSVLNHVVLTTLPDDKLYLGARFRF